jgi:hypothetical protein
MCSRTHDVDILPKNPTPEQADHTWMVTQRADAYAVREETIMHIIEGLYVKSVIEFNPGNIGVFGFLVHNAIVSKTLANYRLFDSHYDCVVKALQNNQPNKGARPDISFSTQVGQIWEYEAVTPVTSRHKSDVSITHYLSACPNDHIDDAIMQICRTSGNDMIIVDYSPGVGKIDIEKTFQEEMPDCEVNIVNLEIDSDRSESIYHIIHPLL